MFETIMRERRRREVEPIIATIDRCAQIVEDDSQRSAEHNGESVDEFRRRIESLREFLDTMGSLFEMVLKFGQNGLPDLAAVFGSTTDSAGSDTTDVEPTPAQPVSPSAPKKPRVAKARRKNTVTGSSAK
jgi:hypothetical protein